MRLPQLFGKLIHSVKNIAQAIVMHGHRVLAKAWQYRVLCNAK
jgi:hypothetical protein